MFSKIIKFTAKLLIVCTFLISTVAVAGYDPEEDYHNLVRFPPKELVLDNFDPDSAIAQKQGLLDRLNSKYMKKVQAFLDDPHTRRPFALLLSLFEMPEYFSAVLEALSFEKDLGENSRLVFFTPEIITILPTPSSLKKSFEGHIITDEQRQMVLRNSVNDMLKALEGVSKGKLQALMDFFTNNPKSRSNKHVVRQLIYWSQILDLQDIHNIVEIVLQWSPFNNGPFSPDAPFGDSPLYPYLKQVGSPQVRKEICSIFLKNTVPGKYSLGDLSKDYSTRVVPELAKLSSQERLDIENFFTPEIIGAVRENRIFLQVLDRLIRPVTKITKRKKNEWSEKMIVEHIYGHYTPTERLEFMKKLTPDFLRQAEREGFYKLIDPESTDITE